MAASPLVAEQVLRLDGAELYLDRYWREEQQVCDALIRKVKIEGLEVRVGRILVPMQREKRMKGGQVKLYERKLYPGYVFIEMETEDDGRVP